MKERPLVMPTWEVRATLERRKTQFRRVVEPQPPAGTTEFGLSDCGEFYRDFPLESADYRCPFGEPGDRLWVQSDWSVKYQENTNSTWWIGPQGCGLSFTTHGKAEILGPRDPAEMPQWVSQELRLPTLELVGRRVERLQEISQEDAKAEGVDPGCLTCGENCLYTGGCGCCRPDYRDSFAWEWNESNPAQPWVSNPWVWVGEYRVGELNALIEAKRAEINDA